MKKTLAAFGIAIMLNACLGGNGEPYPGLVSSIDYQLIYECQSREGEYSLELFEHTESELFGLILNDAESEKSQNWLDLELSHIETGWERYLGAGAELLIDRSTEGEQGFEAHLSIFPLPPALETLEIAFDCRLK